MRLGILLGGSGLFIRDWESGFAFAKDAGYSCVELAAVDATGGWPGADLGKCGSAAEAIAVADAARAHGLEVSACQCHVEYLQAAGAELRKLVEHTSRMMDCAAAAGIPLVHTVTGPPAEADPWPILAELYAELLSHAAGLDGAVQLAVEPVFAYCVGNLATTERLLADVGDDRLGINFDPSHFPYHDESPLPFIRRFAGRIVHAHLKDAVVRPGAGDGPNTFAMSDGREFAFTAPGDGQIEFPEILSALRQAGYDGVVSLELGHGVPDPADAARRCVPFAQDAAARSGVLLT